MTRRPITALRPLLKNSSHRGRERSCIPACAVLPRARFTSLCDRRRVPHRELHHRRALGRRRAPSRWHAQHQLPFLGARKWCPTIHSCRRRFAAWLNSGVRHHADRPWQCRCRDGKAHRRLVCSALAQPAATNSFVLPARERPYRRVGVLGDLLPNHSRSICCRTDASRAGARSGSATFCRIHRSWPACCLAIRSSGPLQIDAV